MSSGEIQQYLFEKLGWRFEVKKIASSFISLELKVYGWRAEAKPRPKLALLAARRLITRYLKGCWEGRQSFDWGSPALRRWSLELDT